MDVLKRQAHPKGYILEWLRQWDRWSLGASHVAIHGGLLETSSLDKACPMQLQ